MTAKKSSADKKAISPKNVSAKNSAPPSPTSPPRNAPAPESAFSFSFERTAISFAGKHVGGGSMTIANTVQAAE